MGLKIKFTQKLMIACLKTLKNIVETDITKNVTEKIIDKNPFEYLSFNSGKYLITRLVDPKLKKWQK